MAVKLRVGVHPGDGTERMFDVQNADDDFCYLTTLGRVSGKPHEIEIWFAVDGDTLYMLSGGGGRSDWVQNLRTKPVVTVRVGDITYDAAARVIDDPAEGRRARTLVFDKYQPRNKGSLDGWRESALPIAIDVIDVVDNR